MTFQYDGTQVFLLGESNSVSIITHQQLRRMVHTNAIAECYHLVAQNKSASLSFTNNTSFTEVLGKFSSIFKTPTSLPPDRTVQHRIHLKEGTSPINVKPYRYPHFQKI